MTVFDCYENNYYGVTGVVTSVTGQYIGITFDASNDIPEVITSVSGNYAAYAYVNAGVTSVVTSVSADVFIDVAKTNWVAWSKIGEASFIFDRVNDAGYRPMSWPGSVYKILKLGKNAVVYGSGGVTMMAPVSSPFATFGFSEISNIGVMNKNAIAGDEFVHYFIDTNGWLNKLSSSGLEPIGYEEFLSELVNPVLTYDSLNKKLFVSSASAGYVFYEGVLTGGYAGLTGIDQLAITSTTLIGPEEITIDNILIVTDILDFGYRGLKSIEALQFDVTTNGNLYAAIDYRYNKVDDFKTSRWSKLNNYGIVHLRTSGIEFRVRLRSLSKVTMELSYINIQFKVFDKRFSRGPIGVTNAN